MRCGLPIILSAGDVPVIGHPNQWVSDYTTICCPPPLCRLQHRAPISVNRIVILSVAPSIAAGHYVPGTARQRRTRGVPAISRIHFSTAAWQITGESAVRRTITSTFVRRLQGHEGLWRITIEKRALKPTIPACRTAVGEVLDAEGGLAI